jgi:hypothetical protein
MEWRRGGFIKEFTTMTNTTSKAKAKRLSKSERLHIRRLKQAARKAGTVYTANRSVRPSA